MNQQVAEHLLFGFTRDGDRWECRPSEMWWQIGAACFLSGAGLLVFMSGPFLLHPGGGVPGRAFAFLFCLGASLLAWGAWRYWRLHRVPLAVDGAGRVSYGDREVCSGGSVRSVRIVPDPQAEHGDCKLVLECADGSRAELPGPFFGALSDRDTARALGRELAAALRVTLVEAN